MVSGLKGEGCRGMRLTWDALSSNLRTTLTGRGSAKGSKECTRTRTGYSLTSRNLHSLVHVRECAAKAPSAGNRYRQGDGTHSPIFSNSLYFSRPL